MKLNLKDKRLCIFGFPGQGKTNLLCYLASLYGERAFIYDTMHEYPTDAAFDIYRPADRWSVPTMEKVLNMVVRRRYYRFVAIDEANRFLPSKPRELPQIIGEINDCCRHPEYGFTPVFVARRPTQLNQDITELAHYLIIFHLKGRNDIDALNNFNAGLGDAVIALPPFHFMVVDERREWHQHKPVPLMGTAYNPKPAETIPL